jgi:hypothetical protein
MLIKWHYCGKALADEDCQSQSLRAPAQTLHRSAPTINHITSKIENQEGEKINHIIE